MNWDELKGNWKELKGFVKAKWGKFTDDDLMQINGTKDILLGKLQEVYGETKEDATRHIDEFLDSFDTQKTA